LARLPLFYVACLGKILWPQSLAVVYPSLDVSPAWLTVGAWVLVPGICVLGIWLRKREPYLAVGWFWYLAALTPAAVLWEAGARPDMADRFAYVPLIGVFISIAWGFAHMARGTRHGRIALCCGAGVVISGLMGLAWSQANRWQNSLTLFTHAVRVSPENPIGREQLGFALACQGKHAEAARQLTEALRLRPDYAEAHADLGLVLYEQDRFQEAIGHFSEALRIDPKCAAAHAYWALALTRNGLLQEAKRHYAEALRIRPDDAETHNNLGVVLYGEGRFREAAHHYSEALRIRPDYGDARKNLNNLMRLMDRTPDARDAE
jgi:tetratricopeptide (TPR) repeat protein